MSTSKIFGMKRLVYWCAGGLLCVNFVPHAVPAIARKSCEAPDTEAPEELVTHVRKIATAMGLVNSDRISVFINSGFTSVCGGCTLLPMGAVIGLPRTVLFQSENDIKQSSIAIRGEPVDWDSEEGKKLLKLLSPTAKLINFRIAHEIGHLRCLDFVYHMFLSPVALVFGYHFAVFTSKVAFPSRIVAAFPILFSLALVAHLQVSSSLRHWQEYRADKTAALCRRSYAEGGVLLMQTNLQLDSILREPPSKYSLEKIVSSFSTHPSYKSRLERLNELVISSSSDLSMQ